MPTNPEITLSAETQERIETLISPAMELMDGRYARVPGVSFSSDSGDDSTLKSSLGETSPLDIELNFSSGGYWTVYGESRWITIYSPATDEKTMVEVTYTHPTTYRYKVFKNDTPLQDSPEIDTELAYAEQVMDIFATDLAQKALRRRRRANHDQYPDWLNVRNELKINETAYVLSALVNN